MRNRQTAMKMIYGIRNLKRNLLRKASAPAQDRHQPIFLHRQVEHLQQILNEEKSTALRSHCLVSINISGFSSTLWMGGISLHPWKIILLFTSLQLSVNACLFGSPLFRITIFCRLIVTLKEKSQFQGITIHPYILTRGLQKRKCKITTASHTLLNLTTKTLKYRRRIYTK